MQYYDGFSRGCAYRRVMHAKFGLLTGGNRTALPRQQTLHALQRGGGGLRTLNLLGPPVQTALDEIVGGLR